jgi:hypothetical protein
MSQDAQRLNPAVFRFPDNPGLTFLVRTDSVVELQLNGASLDVYLGPAGLTALQQLIGEIMVKQREMADARLQQLGVNVSEEMLEIALIAYPPQRSTRLSMIAALTATGLWSDANLQTAMDAYRRGRNYEYGHRESLRHALATVMKAAQ